MLSVHGGDAVGLAVLLQAQLLLVQIHRRGIDSCAFQVHANPLTPKPPDHSRGQMFALIVKNLLVFLNVLNKYKYVG